MKINCEFNRRLNLKNRQINYLGYISKMAGCPWLSEDVSKIAKPAVNEEVWCFTLRGT
jgi:hypothetical protein